MEILTRELVAFPMEAQTKMEALSLLSDALWREKRISSKELFMEDVLKREKEFTTGFGGGFAIPHGKSDAVLTPSIAVGRSSHPLDWDAMDEKPVFLVFLLAVPESHAADTHLRILAKLAENLMDDQIREDLLSLESSEQLYHYTSRILGGV